MSTRRAFVIDTDTASDDAVALWMALRDPTVDVRAITVVAGNVPLDQAVHVALDRSMATRIERRNVVVETRGDYSAGQTVVDHLGLTDRAPNADVVLEASRDAFLAMLRDRLRA